MKRETEPTIRREGEAIILPSKPALSYDDAIKWLTRARDAENAVVDLSEQVDCHPWDGALAMAHVLKDKFGFVTSPDASRTVHVGPRQTARVPWGRFTVPSMTGWLATGCGYDENGRFVFQITAHTLAKHAADVAAIAEAVRVRVRTASIYSGKALRVAFTDDDGDPIPMPVPEFLDLTGVDPSALVLSDRVRDLIAWALFTPIERAEECRRMGIPLRRGILLAGDPGTGKTLTARIAAVLAVRHGWTFVDVTKPADLAYAVRFVSGRFTPAVIFCEDVDRAMSTRDDTCNEILNAIDGVEKTAEIITVLTTNHVNEITLPMLRPGRLDAVLNIGRPDAPAVARLIRLYGGDAIGRDVQLDEPARMLAGSMPAVVAEVVQRAKLAALTVSRPGVPVRITDRALVLAAQSIAEHAAMMRPTPIDNRSNYEKGAAILADAVRERTSVLAATYGVDAGEPMPHATLLPPPVDRPDETRGNGKANAGKVRS